MAIMAVCTPCAARRDIAGRKRRVGRLDLGISGRTALVCASSAGLGFACAWALAAEGVRVFINGRDPARVAAALAKLQTSFKTVSAVAGDITSKSGRAAIL